MAALQHQWKALSVSLTDAILTISMNRPKANAMSPELLNELIQAFNQASNDNNIKGVLLRSNLKYLSFQQPISFSLFNSFCIVPHSVLVLISQLCTIYLLLVIGHQSINLFLILSVVV
jgi:hypothetical protein